MRIQIVGPSPEDTPALRKAVEASLDEFEVFFKTLGNAEGLMNAERALLRTFVLAHVLGRVQVLSVPEDQRTSSDVVLDDLLGGSTSQDR